MEQRAPTLLTVIGGNVPLMIASGNGIGAPIGFVIAAKTVLIFAVGFAAMAPHVGKTDVFYAFVTRGLGIFMALVSQYKRC
jgi:hypothetical protein